MSSGKGSSANGNRGRTQRSKKLNVEKYSRGDGVPRKSIKDVKLRGRTAREEAKHKQTAEHAAKAEILQPYEAGHLEAEGMERTYKFTQAEIRENVSFMKAMPKSIKRGLVVHYLFDDIFYNFRFFFNP